MGTNRQGRGPTRRRRPKSRSAGLGLLALCLVPSALAGVTKPIRANLDADPGVERALPQKVGSRWRVAIEDRCNGKLRRHRISGLGNSIDVLRVTDVDRVRPEEVFFVLRVGTSQRSGGGRIVRLEEKFVGECPQPRKLFAYSTARPLFRPPRSSRITKFALNLSDFSRRWKGREVRVRETYTMAGEQNPTERRVSYYRYASARERFVLYETRLEKIRKRPPRPT